MKRFLLSLLGIISFGLNFGYCDNVSSYIDGILLFSGTLNNSVMTGSYPTLFGYGDDGPGTYCINFLNLTKPDGDPIASSFSFSFGFANTENKSNPANKYMVYANQTGNWICLYGNKPYMNLASKYSANFTYKVFNLSDLLNSVLPDISGCQSDLSTCQFNYSSCQSDYSSCQNDYSSCSSSLGICGTSLNSCQNALGNCMQGNYGTGINWSILNINGIEFPGKPLINVNIPDYITWDYSSTDANFDLNVGSGYDQDYIDSIVSINSYRPTSEDFTNVFVSGLTLVMPYIVIVLFIIFVRKLIKRIFK